MKGLILLLLLLIPGAAFALEQSFTQQGLKASIRLSPEKLETQSEVKLSISLSKDGASPIDREVTLEVYERNVVQPIIQRPVNLLGAEYVDYWHFDKAGDYRLIIRIAGRQRTDDVMLYEINASVMEPAKESDDHGFFSHHFGAGHWGWWGAGLMALMMVPMMILL